MINVQNRGITLPILEMWPCLPWKTSVCCYAAVFWEKQPSEQRNTSSIQASGAIQLKQVLTTGIYEVFPA